MLQVQHLGKGKTARLKMGKGLMYNDLKNDRIIYNY
jgi:hypothetical protein